MAATGIHFRGLHLQPYYRDRFGFTPEDYPNATYTSQRIVSLPLYPEMEEADARSVADAVIKLIEYYRRG